MSGVEVDPQALDSVARAFRNGGDDLEAVGEQPAAPNAGTATGVVASALAQLAVSAAGVVEGMWQLGSCVDHAAREYAAADARSRDALDVLLKQVG